MKSFGAFLFIALLHTVTAQRSPTIFFISPQQIKEVGEFAQLECSVQDEQDFPILWVKINGSHQLPISSGARSDIRDGRFSLLFNMNTATYTIQIRDIQETDAGYYQCQIVTDVNNKITAQVELQLHKPSGVNDNSTTVQVEHQVLRPPFIFDNSTRSKVVVEGSSVQLECYAEGLPVPRITWRREKFADFPTGDSIHRGNVLHISNVTMEYRGSYICYAENGVGCASHREISVEIMFAPIMRLQSPHVGQALGHNAVLVCSAESFPPSSVIWKKNEEVLSTGNDYTILSFQFNENRGMYSLLFVKAIKKSQYGEYTCVMSNDVGTAEKKVVLRETDTVQDVRYD